MVEYFLSSVGFLGTRAVFGMDVVVVFLIMLPLFIVVAIVAVKYEYMKLHLSLQMISFILTLIFLSFFLYNIFFIEGVEKLIAQSSIEPLRTWISLILHLFVAFLTLLMWFFALLYAFEDSKRRALPGVYSRSHREAGRRVFIGIVLTSFSGMVLYWILFDI